MELWDEIYKKVSDAASYTAKETERLSGLAKLKYNLMLEKVRLEEAYKEMGEIYYKQMKTSDIDEKKVAKAYDNIEKSIVEIERLKTQINVLKNIIVCGVCGVKLEKDMAFCPKCGAKQVESDEPEVEIEIEYNDDNNENKTEDATSEQD